MQPWDLQMGLDGEGVATRAFRSPCHHHVGAADPCLTRVAKPLSDTWTVCGVTETPAKDEVITALSDNTIVQGI